MEHRSIIDLWPSLNDFASDIGVEPNTAKQMRTRSNIKSEYWHLAVKAAAQRGIDQVSFSLLAIEPNRRLQSRRQNLEPAQ